MRKDTIAVFGFILLAASLSLWGCPKKSEVSTGLSSQKEETSAASTQKKDMKKEGSAEAKSDAREPSAERSAAASGGLQPVLFDYDQSVVHGDTVKIMVANAQWLKEHPTVKVKIEGYCDNRGTVEYNQALGQRRAANAGKFLTDLGISPRRISLISFGKENPVCKEQTEACWQKNRRDDFVAVP